MVSGIEIRDARVGDADRLADAWREFGRYYADINPALFRIPDSKGLPAWFESRLEENRGEDGLCLVAERARRVIGFVQAQIWPPAEDAHRQLMREIAEPILKVDSIMVLEGERAAGVGTPLRDGAVIKARLMPWSFRMRTVLPRFLLRGTYGIRATHGRFLKTAVMSRRSTTFIGIRGPGANVSCPRLLAHVL